MRSRRLWLVLAVVAASLVAISLIALPKAPEWTTDSPEALDAFLAGIEAERKFYRDEAARYFQRAVELDPGFVIAKLYLAESFGMVDERKKRDGTLLDEVAAADLDRLRPRERFLVERMIARRERRFDDYARLLDEYLAAHPSDPWAVSRQAQELWERGDYEAADRWYRQLLELDPNWVFAYNHLGYIAMQQGRFAEAEEYFTSYRFIAPDQANPHDSLGELYLTEGRYEEAETSFETAVRIRPDFWYSYYHLGVARSLMGDHAGAREAIARMASLENAPRALLEEWNCEMRFRELEANRRWVELLHEDALACQEDANPGSYMPVVVHRAAVQLGRLEVADRIEARLRDLLEEARKEGRSSAFDQGWPALLHLEAVRAAFGDRLGEAEEKFREADAHLTYLTTESAMFKIDNQIMLVETLLAQGKDAEAHTLLAKVRAVNPMMTAQFEEEGLKTLGVERT